MHGLEDCLTLNQDQITKALYGSVQLMQKKIESLETELSELRGALAPSQLRT